MSESELEEKRDRVASMVHQHIGAANTMIDVARRLGLTVTLCVQEESGASTLFDSTAEITDVDITRNQIFRYPRGE